MRYFKGKQFKQEIILVAVGYYCRFSLSYRGVSEILQERGVSVYPTTIIRWVHEYDNLIYQIWKKKNKTAQLSWHLDETYIKPISKSKENGAIYIMPLIRMDIRLIFNFVKHAIIKRRICWRICL